MTQELILDGAKRLYMQYGIKSVTMDDVARELGISKKTLYLHVENKNDLISRIIERHIQEEKEALGLITEAASDAIEEIVMMARHVIKMLRAMRPTAMFDLKKHYRECWKLMDNFHLKYVYETIRSNIEEGKVQGLYLEELDSDIIAKLYVGKTMLLTNEEIFPMRDYDRDKLYAEYIMYHLRGIVTERGLALLKTHQPVNS